MRTTVDLPDDLHAIATAIAKDTHQTLSLTIANLMRRGLSSGGRGEITTSSRTGLPVAHVGKTITTEDIRKLEEDDL
jgi:hypothetical protein